MIKIKSLFVLLILISFPIAAQAQNRSIFIEAAGTNPMHNAFFNENFRMEGTGAGYTITEVRDEAGYIFRFNVVPNVIIFDDGTQSPPGPDDPQFNIVINLIDNTTTDEVVSFGFQYNSLDDMYEFTQFLFLRAAINIPNDFETVVEEVIDDSWQNKWIYLRFSVDYPITFYRVLSKGLAVEGTSVYSGPFLDPITYTPVDHRTTALPAVTAGLQVQILNWLSIEPNFQVIYGDRSRDFTMGAGGRLLFPIKSVRNVLLEPYGAFNYPIVHSPDFTSFPRFAVGAGIQVGIRGGPSGVLFLDLNYMHSIDRAVLKNLYGDLYPLPEEIHFTRYGIGLGIGYKHGFIDR